MVPHTNISSNMTSLVLDLQYPLPTSFTNMETRYSSWAVRYSGMASERLQAIPVWTEHCE